MRFSARDYRMPRYKEIPNVGLYLEQTVKYINECLAPIEISITPSMLSNYVKKGYIDRPVKKQYYADQIAYAIYIVIIKQVLSMDNIASLFVLQKATYTLPVAYDYFCSELEKTLVAIFEDKEEPSLTLIGDDNIVIYKNSKYIEKGYTAIDKCDGDITNKVIVTGTVDTNRVGTYTINYKVVDNSGNEASVDRKITVRERPSYYGNGSIYLTFDDGPSYLTKEILDILDEEGIKATFFVTSGGEYVKRAYNSGHTIALHTSSHKYSYVYSNEENYFNDLNTVSDSVYNSIGIRCKFIRFPGGSSNTISRNYNKGIMSRLVNAVTNKGYVYFDWNVDSNDAGGDGNNSNKIYNNVINGLSHNKTNIVLMHDSANHRSTVNALRDIIRYGKDNGYSFKAITNDTPVVRHGVNN